MSSLAIIPARGGSKRLKKKNIINFHGKPIIAYTIAAAIKSNCFDRIVVSTDDLEIYRVSKKYHHDVVLRSKELATDKASVSDVCYDFLKKEIKNNKTYDLLTVLYPTACMRTSDDIKKVLKKIRKSNYSSCFAVTSYPFPVHQAVFYKKGKAKKLFPKVFSMRESQVPKYYVDNGSTYSLLVKNFLKDKKLITNNFGLHIMPQEKSVDIDTAFQLKLAKIFFKMKN